MKLNYNNSKKIGTILGIILFIGLIAGITYAVFNWRSTNTNISVNTKCFQVEGSSSYTLQGSNMLLFDEDDVIDFENHTITYKNGMLYYPFIVSRDSSCNTDVYYEITFNITNLPAGYENGAIKYKIIGDMSSYTSQQMANPLNEELVYNYYGAVDTSGTTVIYSKNLTINSSDYVGVVLYLDGDFVPEDAPNLSLSGSIEVNAYQGNSTSYIGKNAAEYIRELYSNSPKTVVTNNNIDYNYATDVSLMNDRLGGTTESLDGGDIRYYGSSPNNFVWLGDVYNNFYGFSVTSLSGIRNAGEKKLWRIIGAFDGKIKLVSNDPLPFSLPWDTSAKNVDQGMGINQWGPSGTYKGADLMKLLNPGYENNQDLDTNGYTITVNNSLYWNKGTGTVYKAYRNDTLSNVYFSEIGLSSKEKKYIDDTTVWYLGAYKYNQYNAYSDGFYLSERQSDILGKSCSSGNYCNDNVTRTPTWIGSVGLLYVSDYGYSRDFTVCSDTLRFTSSSCKTWIGNHGLTINAENKDGYGVYCYRTLSTSVESNYCSSSDAVFPSIYLKPNTSILSGIGTESDPYILNID